MRLLSPAGARWLVMLVLSLSTAALAEEAPAPPASESDFMTIRVSVTDGVSGAPVADTPVFLRAARPRGPFEPTAPKPQHEWASVTDPAGNALFAKVPRALTASGLRVHAVATAAGMPFQSPPSVPTPGETLQVKVYERGTDTSGVKIANLRTIVEVWEGYLVFTQYYTLTNTGKTALDVKMLPDKDFEKGLPITLPLKAQGIQASGPGESLVVNSTVYWTGVLQPEEKANLQVRFSMSADDPEFTYTQQMEYPTQNVEVVVPLQTRFKKIPRLDGIELRPKGFSESDRGKGIFGLREDWEFVGARGRQVETGDSFAFQLRGLPFEKPMAPWFVLAAAILVAIVALVLMMRDARRSSDRREEREKMLVAEREGLFEQILWLQAELEAGRLTDTEHELLSAELRSRLALVLNKLEELAGEP